MKKLMLTCVVLMLLAATGAVADKTYRVPAVTIEADLSEDGSMQVREARSYTFKGTYRYAYRTFKRDKRIEYSDFIVREEGKPYFQDGSEEPGTFSVEHSDDEITVRWNFRARNETRTFSVEYQVLGAVKRHKDAAVLYYQFIGSGFRKKTGQLDIAIRPPAPVEDWKVRQWAHGPLWGESTTGVQGVVTATCTNLPRKRFFELRILYPPEIFPGAPIQDTYISAAVTEEEAAWAEEANARRLRAIEKAEALKTRQGWGLKILPFIVLGAGYFFVRLFRDPNPNYPQQTNGKVPDDGLCPAMVGYLVNGRSVVPATLMATLMDLGRRGFLEFQEEYELGQTVFGKEKWHPKHRWVLDNAHLEAHREELLAFEEALLDFVFNRLGSGPDPATGKTTVAYDVFKKEKKKVRGFFPLWSEKVKREGQGRGFFSEESLQARNQGYTLGAGMAILAVVLIPVVQVVALIPGIAALNMIIAAGSMVRPTDEGARLLAGWKGFRDYLKGRRFRSEDPDSLVDVMGSYFTYGVLFGLSKNTLGELGDRLPADRGAVAMPWYHPVHGGRGMPATDFGSSFSTAVATMNTAMSSSTGAGGGASGGGGGGGAGGGGGGAG